MKNPRLSPGVFGRMYAESERVALPVNWREDMYTDQKYLSGGFLETPARRFLWILRENGTHVIGLDPTSERPPVPNPSWNPDRHLSAILKAYAGHALRFYYCDSVFETVQAIDERGAVRACAYRSPRKASAVA